jgi:hypothetical protein
MIEDDIITSVKEHPEKEKRRRERGKRIQLYQQPTLTRVIIKR